MARRNYKKLYHDAIEILIERINGEAEAAARCIGWGENPELHQVKNETMLFLLDAMTGAIFTKKADPPFYTWMENAYCNDVKYIRWRIEWTDGKDYVTLTAKRK